LCASAGAFLVGRIPESAAMPPVKECDTEPIPGYRLVQFLGRGGFGEVWKCEAPGGLFKAVKFVRGESRPLDEGRPPVEQEWQALQLVKTIRHPFLLGIDRLELLAGELVVVMELADRSLADAFREHRDAGRAGVPRVELLSYLREAAEALDVINLQHHLQHLDVKPANLFLVNRHVKVGDFGLLSRQCDEKEAASDARPAGLTPLYCAPETLKGVVSPRSDQYSLAVVYLELLTGRLPYTARNPRELMVRRATSDPDLSSLPDDERPVVARALARDPEARFASCTEFVRALAPELMPLNSSPFLDGLLTDGALADLPARAPSDSRPVPNHRTPQPPAGGPDFAGHRLIKCLARGPLCETWKARAPDGRARLVLFPTGLTDGGDPAEAEVLRFLGAGHHPNVQPLTVLRNGLRVALVCDPPEATLLDRLHQCRTVGLPGVPRSELLDYLQTAAEALGALCADHGLQHLCLTPRTLVLDGRRLLVAEMGLGQLLWLPAGQPVGRLNGRYSAPELIAGGISAACDQYSLAVIYQELLTGTAPFRGVPGRGKGRPNLDLLPAHDRGLIARALDPDPERRFATCAELFDALDRAVAVPRASVLLPPVISAPTAAALAGPLPPPADLIGQMVRHAAGPLQVREADGFGYLLEPGRRLIHTCAAYLSRSLARLKLSAFQQQGGAEVRHCDGGVVVLELPLLGSFLQRWAGRRPALMVRISLISPRATAEVLTGMCIEVWPVNCRPDRARIALERHGPAILSDLRTCLQVEPQRRDHLRLPFEHSLGLFPVLDGKRIGDGLACRGQNLSQGGVSLLAKEAPATSHLYVQSLLTPQLATVALLGRVTRVRPRDDGLYEIGAAFVEWPETFVATRAGVRTVAVRS
jgi:serine/threonine protein kinase